MEILIISNAISIIAGALIALIVYIKLDLKKCKHNWRIIEDGALHRYNKQGVAKEKIGFAKVYECTNCKQMKKELVLF